MPFCFSAKFHSNTLSYLYTAYFLYFTPVQSVFPAKDLASWGVVAGGGLLGTGLLAHLALAK